MTKSTMPVPREGWISKIADQLNVRFALVLAVALLPLGVVSLMQTAVLQREVQRRTQVALLGETLNSAAGEIGVIRNAQGVVAALASALTVLPPPDACADMMRQTAVKIPAASLIAFFPKDGMMVCSSNGRTHNFSGNPLFESVIASHAPNFVVNRAGPVSGTSVLGVSHPVFDKSGIYQGYVSASLPHKGLERLNTLYGDDAVVDDASVVFWTFDREGEVLTASGGLESVVPLLPRARKLTSFINQAETVFQATSTAGRERTYATVAIVPGQLYLMSSWDQKSADPTRDVLVWSYLPPVTMWIVGLIVAAVASERLVTRHIRTLSRSILKFANGDRVLGEGRLRAAPTELRQVEEAFHRMTLNITRGEAELEDTIRQKEMLLREVHHRVKNNLQLIASIMNMQMRKATAPEAKVLLKGLQDRVMSLATVHRGLYQTSGLADVRADELFRDIVRQIVNLSSTPDRKFVVDLDVDEMRLTPDQAVPLSLLLTEAMANALKYAGTVAGKPVKIKVRLKHEPDGLEVMEVINSLPAEATPRSAEAGPASLTTSTGLGEQLLSAFSQQVGGTLTRDITNEHYRLTLRFKVRSLTEIDTPEDDAPAKDEI